jgi:hypothetical protein
LAPLCVSNPTPVISFATEHKLLDKSPFYNLILYCKSNLSMNISKSCNVATSPTNLKYKFGIDVPNAISLDKRNKNSLWQDAIETKLKQLTDYETFIVLDSGEDIPKE